MDNVLWMIIPAYFWTIVYSQEHISSGICQDRGDVCSSLLHLETKSIIKESDNYCACIDCDSTWDDEPTRKSFTWYHYTRRDWQVQYHMCYPIDLTEEVCTARDAVAALVTSSVDRWQPMVQQVQCICPRGAPYYLSGWSLIPDDNRWEYYYTCHMSPCNITDSCLQAYKDPHTHHKTMVEFGCYCPVGQKCVEDKVKPRHLDDEDYIVPDVVGYCQKIKNKR